MNLLYQFFVNLTTFVRNFLHILSILRFLVIRKSFDQYINLRPVKLLKGAPCPLKDVTEDEINMTFIRENTEGEYAGSGSWLFKGKPNEVVIQDGVFSRKGCERVIRYAMVKVSK